MSAIFEHSPWVAAAVADERPFSSVAALHRAMCRAMRGASRAQKLELIRAHPELARKMQMSPDSVQEQAGAGLDSLTPEEFAVFGRLNAAYRSKFGFPFILAVRGKDKTLIRVALERRVQNDLDVEFETCLEQIELIAKSRLEALLTG
ncbi:MAG: 2-oxo-4-hydroxy-4-carboxy-5-ureidoimidazoline decarboxylase [Pleurocapsa sp. SU_196_0]|nr:2-oxo-4-hydroxy-4-carboxy-5-ureidoimidazoline decarboxylase [Pleurocapsa sp. SU_196_0]